MARTDSGMAPPLWQAPPDLHIVQLPVLRQIPPLVLPPLPPPDFLVPSWPSGTIIAGRFRITGVIAPHDGGVYRALDLQTDQSVAIKRRTTRQNCKQLRHEAAILSALPPGIGPTPIAYGSRTGPSDPSSFLVMEYLEGDTLRDLLPGMPPFGHPPPPPLPIETTIEYTRSIAQLLGAVHDAGLVYVSLHPGQVLRLADGSWRLIDHEYAVSSGTPATHLRVDNNAPEEFAHRPLTPAVNVYNLGVLLWHLAAGVLPYSAGRSDAGPGFLRHFPASRRNPALQARPLAATPLDAIIARCLEPDPSDRYQSMTALIAALDGIRCDHADQQRNATETAAE